MTEAGREQRNYYLKAYLGWWTGMALLGSLLLNGPSKTFLGAVYNPVAWSGAALLALLVAAVQTHYRNGLKQRMAHPLFNKGCAVLFWGMQCLFHWERLQKKGSGFGWFFFAVLILMTLGLFLSWCIDLRQSLRRDPLRESIPAT